MFLIALFPTNMIRPSIRVFKSVVKNGSSGRVSETRGKEEVRKVIKEYSISSLAKTIKE